MQPLVPLSCCFTTVKGILFKNVVMPPLFWYIYKNLSLTSGISNMNSIAMITELVR